MSNWSRPRTDPVPSGLKRCSRCEIDQEPEAFYANIGRRDGLDSWCKKCVDVRTIRYRQIQRGSHEEVRDEG